MYCASGSVRTPSTRSRVVCGLREVMLTRSPTSALTSVDLPTLGRPITPTMPTGRVSAATSGSCTDASTYAVCAAVSTGAFTSDAGASDGETSETETTDAANAAPSPATVVPVERWRVVPFRMHAWRPTARLRVDCDPARAH